MRLTYTIEMNRAPAGLAATLPESLRRVRLREYTGADGTIYRWTFEAADFPLLPELCEWLRGVRAGAPATQVVQTGARTLDEREAASAPLFWLTGGDAAGVTVLGGRAFADATCPECGFVDRRIADDARLDVRLPAGHGASVFAIPAANVIVAAAAVVDAIRAAGADGGLRTFPVSVEGAGVGRLVGLYAGPDLGWPAAPHGVTGAPCSTCGRPVAHTIVAGVVRRSPGLPRFALYRTFARPAREADWMWSSFLGQQHLILSARARAALVDASAGDPADSREPLRFHAHGWDPDERGAAFLPEPYQCHIV